MQFDRPLLAESGHFRNWRPRSRHDLPRLNLPRPASAWPVRRYRPASTLVGRKTTYYVDGQSTKW